MRLLMFLFNRCTTPLGLIPIFFVIMLLGIASRYPEGHFFGYVHEITLTSLGLFLFFKGFGAVRRRWLVSNTPTSKVRSVAMGLCELAGTAREKELLRSPLRSAPCVYYQFKVESQHRDFRGRWSAWSLDRVGRSTNYFYLDDSTGKILVDPLNAEMNLTVDYNHTEQAGNTRTRYTEAFICPGDPVYVLGTVRKFCDNIQERDILLRERLQEIKADPAKLKSFDIDNDGTVSGEEWDRARAYVEEDLLKEELQRPAAANEDDLIVDRGEAEKTFIIADCAERTLSGRLLARSILLVGGGMLLVGVMCVSMVARSRLLPGYLAIPWEQLYRH